MSSYRLQSWRLHVAGELRLIFQRPATLEVAPEMGPPEPLERRIVRVLEGPEDRTEQQLEDLRKSIDPTEWSPALDAAEQILRTERVNPTVQLTTLQKLRQRAIESQREASKRQLEQARQNTAGLATGRQTPAENGAEQAPEVFWNPSTWTAEHQRTARNIAIAGGVVVGGILLFKAIKKAIKHWFGKATKEGKEAAQKSGGGFFTKLFIGLGVGAATLFGAKWYIDRHFGKAIDAAAEAAAKAKEAAEKAGQATKTAVETVANAAQEATAKGKEALESGTLQEEIEQGVEDTARRLTGRGLIAMNHTLAEQVGIDHRKSEDMAAVGDLLVLDEVRRMPLSELMAVTSLDTAQKAVPNATAEKAKALLFLATVARNEARSATSGFSKDAKTLGEFFDSLHDVPQVFGNFAEQLQGVALTDLTDPKKLATVMEGAFVSGGTETLAANPRTREHFARLGLQGKEVAFLTYCAMPTRATMLLSDLLDTEKDEPEFTESLRAMQQELLSPETRQFLHLFLHERSQEFAPLIDELLEGNLRVLDAVQLYSYIKLCSRGGAAPQTLATADSAGVFLLQMKMIHLLSRKDPHQAERLKAHVFDLATRNARSPSLPPQTIDMLKRFGSMAGSFLAKAAWEQVTDTWDRIAAWRQESDAFEVGTNVGGIVVGGVVGRSMLRTGLGMYDFLTRDALQRMQTRVVGRKVPLLDRILPLGRNAWDITTSRAIDRGINEIANTAQKASNKHVYQTANRWVKRGFDPKSYAKFQDQLNALKPSLSAGDAALVARIEAQAAKVYKQRHAAQILRFGPMQRTLRATGRVFNALGPTQKILGPLGAAMTAKDALEFYGGGKAELEEAIAVEKDTDRKGSLAREKNAREGGLWIDGAGLALTSAGLTAPIGGAMLLTKAAVDVTGYRQSIEEGTEYLTMKREDLRHSTGGNVLYQVRRTAPGKFATWGQEGAAGSIMGLAADWDLDADEAFREGNTASRNEAYAAYFGMHARLVPLNAQELSQQHRDILAQRPEYLQTLNQNMLDYYVKSAITYIKEHTKATYVAVDPETLRRAELYAALSVQSYRDHLMGKENDFGKKNSSAKESDVSMLQQRQSQLLVESMQEEIRDGAAPMDVLPQYFLMSLQHDLANCEAQILQSEYADWAAKLRWTFTDTAEMQALARSMVAENLYAALQRIVKGPVPATAEQYDRIVSALRNTLVFEPNALAERALYSKQRDYHKKSGNDVDLLSAEGMLRLIAAYPLDRDWRLAA